MVFKIVGGMGFLVLLVFAILSGGKLADAKQEIEDLNDRLKTVEEEAATNEKLSKADDLKVQAEMTALKNALTTKGRERERLLKQSALEREKVARKAATEREALITGFATVLNRFGFSPKELDTLLDDLPAKDRGPLLEQIAMQNPGVSAGVEKSRTTEAEVPPSSDDKPEKEAPLVPNFDPAEGIVQVAKQDQPGENPATKLPMEVNDPKLATYTVKRGDTLTQVGRRFDVDVAQLMKLNGIANANMLRVGQVLKIPQN